MSCATGEVSMGEGIQRAWSCRRCRWCYRRGGKLLRGGQNKGRSPLVACRRNITMALGAIEANATPAGEGG